MKSFKSLILLLTIILSFGLSLSSCENESQNQNKQQSAEYATPNAKTDVDQAVRDSISNFKSQIDDISKESKKAVADVSSIKAEVSQLQDNDIWHWLAVGFIFVVALILFVIYHNLLSRIYRQHSDIQKLQKEKQVNSFAPLTVAKSSVPADYESLKHRVLNLEMQVRQLASRPIQPPQPSNPRKNYPLKPASPETGFFANPIQATEPYFKKLLVSRDSDARFSVVISGDKAVFKPLESSEYIGTFISNDAMRAAIEFDGCTPGESPSSMRVIKPGEAEQKDNRWFITKKAQVQLY